ncbi:MAG: hypothetical protein C5B50_00760 [Verrucomicrobia bacterium]|nr:MAG: hypothetical protein C5B50_00760 [Verrucomicrobiota bacterium]
MTYPTLTLPQFSAVMEYAEQHGRTWKAKLSDDWLYARTEGALQVLRNSHGPAWLQSFKPLTCAKAILRPLDITINKRDTGEYRVNLLNGTEDTASYSEDIVGSVGTGIAMSCHRDQHKASGA